MSKFKKQKRVSDIVTGEVHGSSLLSRVIPRSGKARLILAGLILLVILAGGSFAGYKYLMYRKKATTPGNTNTSQPTESTIQVYPVPPPEATDKKPNLPGSG